MNLEDRARQLVGAADQEAEEKRRLSEVAPLAEYPDDIRELLQLLASNGVPARRLYKLVRETQTTFYPALSRAPRADSTRVEAGATFIDRYRRGVAQMPGTTTQLSEYEPFQAGWPVFRTDPDDSFRKAPYLALTTGGALFYGFNLAETPGPQEKWRQVVGVAPEDAVFYNGAVVLSPSGQATRGTLRWLGVDRWVERSAVEVLSGRALSGIMISR